MLLKNDIFIIFVLKFKCIKLAKIEEINADKHNTIHLL